MDLNALRTRVRKLTGVQMESLLTPTELDQIINESYFHISSLADWTFLYADATQTVASGTNTVSLPDPVATPHTVAVVAPESEQALLRYRRIEDFDRYPQWEAEATDGIPWAWSIRTDSEIEVFPTNDDASLELKFRGWKRVDKLSADGDTPIWDEEFHPVVSFDAASRVLSEEGDDSGRSERYRIECLSYLKRMGRRYLVWGDNDRPAKIYASAMGVQWAEQVERDETQGGTDEPR